MHARINVYPVYVEQIEVPIDVSIVLYKGVSREIKPKQYMPV